MRWIRLGTVVLVPLTLSLLGSAAHADPYRWCAHYGGMHSDTSNCGFVTYNQCMDTVSGIGGWCEPNPFYNGRPFRDEYSTPRHGYRPHHQPYH